MNSSIPASGDVIKHNNKELMVLETQHKSGFSRLLFLELYSGLIGIARVLYDGSLQILDTRHMGRTTNSIPHAARSLGFH